MFGMNGDGFFAAAWWVVKFIGLAFWALVTMPFHHKEHHSKHYPTGAKMIDKKTADSLQNTFIIKPKQ